MRAVLITILIVLNVSAECQIIADQSILEANVEKMILHSNRRFFLTGETMKFNLEISCNNKKSNISKIAYVELINSDRESVLRQKIKVEDGQAVGQLYIPSILPSGEYYLISYTQWMLNYPGNRMPIIPVTVINPFRDTDDNNCDSTEIYLSMYFESDGGLLNKSNTIIYEIRNSIQSKPREIRILDTAGNTLQSVECRGKNIGRFEWRPTRDGSFTLILILENDEISYHQLQFNATTSHLTLKKNGKDYFVSAHFEGESAELEFGNKSIPVRPGIEVKIEENQLEKGINLLRLIKDKNVLATRPLMVHPGFKNIKTAIDKSIGTERDKLKLSVSSPDEKAKITVNIRRKELEQDPSIIDDLFFKPYGILIHQPMDYFSKASLWEDIDNLIIIHQKSFDIQYPEKLDYLPEIRGMLLSGSIREKASGSPVTDKEISLTVDTDIPQSFTTVSDKNGDFTLLLSDIAGNMKGYSPVSDKYEVEFKSTYREEFSFIPEKCWTIDSTWRYLIDKKSIEVQLENAYFEFKEDSVIDLNPTEIFYGKPENSYVISEYTSFPTLKDVIREYVQGVSLKEKNDDAWFMVYFTNSQLSKDQVALPMINGIPFQDVKKILELNPSDIERIDIIYSDYILGSINARGIVNFILEENYDGPVFNNPQLNTTEIEGLSNLRISHEPDHIRNPGSRIPDLRTDLYWNPSIDLDETTMEIPFYCSDLKGDYEILISGITESGKLIQQKLEFSIQGK